MANELSNLRAPEGAHKKPKRLGRGEGSGKGKTSGRGSKGQHSRNTVAPWFEGGQMPLHRRLAKRGFKNIHGKSFAEIDLARLSRIFQAGETVTAAEILKRGGVSKVPKDGIKVLGNGELGFPLNIVASGFTAGSLAKIKSAGGTAQLDETFLKRNYAVVKIGRISSLFEEGAEVTAEALVEKKLVYDLPYFGVWVVGGGSCSKALNIKVAKISERAKKDILSAGGEVSIDERRFGSLVLTQEG
jgi:large subunit ribosomal protein L15